MRKTTFTMIFVASVCVTILASIAVVAPKAVRAAVATLIRDQDNAARHSWVGACTISSINNPNCVVPLSAGNEYVIQSVTLQLAYGSSFNSVVLSAFCTSGGAVNTFLSANVPAVSSGGYVFANQTVPVAAYCDPLGVSSLGGVQGSIAPLAANPSLSSGAQIFFSGYYVTLP